MSYPALAEGLVNMIKAIFEAYDNPILLTSDGAHFHVNGESTELSLLGSWKSERTAYNQWRKEQYHFFMKKYNSFLSPRKGRNGYMWESDRETDDCRDWHHFGTDIFQSQLVTVWVYIRSLDLHRIFSTHVELHILEPFFFVLLNPGVAAPALPGWCPRRRVLSAQLTSSLLIDWPPDSAVIIKSSERPHIIPSGSHLDCVLFILRHRCNILFTKSKITDWQRSICNRKF